ncbi:MAG: DUF3943 domain-containing protein [Candidatus Aminicenantes bacterium]|nr:DUF3943 domain-containing protein [Candidatus Aminicenantes bacterium]
MRRWPAFFAAIAPAAFFHRQRSCGLKWKPTLLALVCFAALIRGGPPAYGRVFSESDDPTRPRWPPPPQTDASIFCLSSLRTATDGVNGGGSGAITFSLQQQPFSPASVRLRDDDPEYNTRSPLWAVALRVVSTNVFVWAVDRFVFDYSWSHIGPQSWNNNFKSGWEWDTDRLGMNFFFHPYSGGAFFNSARANGYRYFEAVPFAFFGSLMWEYFGETTRPAYNDIINTTLSGSLFGEILYRLTSNILDDRTTGMERFFREFAAAILSPGRAFSRLSQGKLTRVTPKEVYQKEPLNIALFAGAHWFNEGTTFGTGGLNGFLGIHLDYGDPFEIRPRKPFDFFKLRVDLSYGEYVGKKYLDNVTGYGLLFGKTVHSGNLEMLIGAFQHYNYWDSRIFEVAALGFGGGIIAKWRLAENSNLQTAFHLGIVPLGASNSPYVDIVEGGIPGRDYDYSGGAETKFEGTLNLANRAQVTAIYYLYWLHTYVGPAGNKFIGIFKPRIAIRLFGDLSLGFEYLYFHKDGYLRDFPDVHRHNSEQKLYLMLYF